MIGGFYTDQNSILQRESCKALLHNIPLVMGSYLQIWIHPPLFGPPCAAPGVREMPEDPPPGDPPGLEM